ncbi:hypothetical protein FRC04_002487 [Tulasnella sp. 424]|nr:hypothetical protein FRC04_002487 [Tulasnella sp. 424]
MTTRLPEKLTTLPDVPKAFGDDGGKFYRHYDELADELDEDLVKSLKAQLDSILIFAGLFAGVNSAFLAFTLPQMSANPADDTNALLLQILLRGNSSITSAAHLPSASFTPPPRIYPINILFSVSLTLTLLASFLAVLGQQWIVYYRKRSGGGPEHQRWEQLRRSLGAKRWRLELVLDDLVPSMLQLGLVIFGIAFSLYLSTLSKSLSHVIAAILCTALTIILAMTTCAAFDPWCPFKTTLSRSILPITLSLYVFIISCIVFVVALVSAPFAIMASRFGFQTWQFQGIRSLLYDVSVSYAGMYKGFTKDAMRPADDPEYLRVEAIRRVICVSEDRAALVRAAMNLQTIRNHGSLSSLMGDGEFSTRMFGLGRSYQVRSQWPHDTELIEARAFSTSFFHIWLSAGSFSDIVNLLGWEVDSRGPAQVFDAIRSLCRGALVSFTADCDRCLHCTTLSFSMRVVNLLVDDVRTGPMPFHDVFNEVEGALTKSVDLRLGCVVAAAVLCSMMSRDPGLRWLRSEETSLRRFDPLFEELSMAYRARDSSQMIEVIGRGLATVEFKWKGKPDHELYVRLFELGLSSGIRISGARPILEHFGSLLLYIEIRIRDQAISERDGQRGREHQVRCVQSVVGSLKVEEGFYRELAVWDDVSPSLESYLKAVKEHVETDPANPKNLSAIDLLRRIKDSFPGPARGRSSPYWTFCELLDQIELVFQTRNKAIYEDDTDTIESTGTCNTDKNDVLWHASHSLWGIDY